MKLLKAYTLARMTAASRSRDWSALAAYASILAMIEAAESERGLVH